MLLAQRHSIGEGLPSNRANLGEDKTAVVGIESIIELRKLIHSWLPNVKQLHR
jgi:hypothetical protein